MPFYEYRCSDCDEVFEERRSMAEADLDVRCPSGHAAAKRLLPVFASVRSGSGTGPSPAPRASAPCGSACACH